MLWCCWNKGVQTTVKQGSPHTLARRGPASQRWWKQPAAGLLRARVLRRYRPWGGTPDQRASFFIFVRMYSFSLIWKFLVLWSFKMSPQSLHPSSPVLENHPSPSLLSLPCPCWRESVNLSSLPGTGRHRAYEERSHLGRHEEENEDGVPAGFLNVFTYGIWGRIEFKGERTLHFQTLNWGVGAATPGHLCFCWLSLLLIFLTPRLS